MVKGPRVPIECPPGFEGLRYGKATRPNQHHTTANDVNKNMGGDNVGICVKYTAVAECNKSNMKILTDIEVKNWPKWKRICPVGPGWVEVGQLTDRTRDRCDRMGLCAQYTEVSKLTPSIRPVYFLGFTDYGTWECPVNAPQLKKANIQSRKSGCGGSLLFVCSGSD